ncbi:MAG TPA: Gfo/Idh/MocA family oxidoreductase [Bryobacteraceae bacterium]|nr:Gfo/Idh/MocA family oxidoreductase [Bryobacteraceae bacterium]
MASRRNFLSTFASSVGVTLAAPASVLGANDRIRLGIIGPGDRGQALMREALACQGVEFVGLCDVYTRRLEQAKQLAPNARTYMDYRRLLEDSSIDAVLIATPQHLHCEHFTAVMEAGRHCYQEKTMAFTVDHAKRMRAAYEKAGNRIVSIGHQSCSSGVMQDALALLAGEPMGKITGIHMTMYRNTPHGKPQWARPVYPDMTPENVLWKSFLGDSPEMEFDANRFMNWRFFWEYSGGNVYENMCHQIAFWYKALDLQIPKAATMTGGVYLWKDGREVPDTMCVTLEQPEEMLISWNSGFGNDYLRATEDVLGTDGTIAKGQQIRWLPQRVNTRDREEKLGRTPTAPQAHMQNFFDSIRQNKTPNCPFEVGYRSSIACRMAVESYRQQRTIRWDADREELV